MMNFHGALNHTLHLVIITMQSIMYNPINWLYPWTRFAITNTRMFKVFDDNLWSLKRFIKKEIENRRLNKTRSDIEGKGDFVSLLLDFPDLYADEDITNELLSFFLAATETNAVAATTIIGHLSKNPVYLEQLRGECESALDRAKVRDPSLEGLSKKD